MSPHCLHVSVLGIVVTWSSFPRGIATVSDIELDPIRARLERFTVLDAGAGSTARIVDVELFGREP